MTRKTTITHCIPTHGTVRKRHRIPTATSHQENNYSKATSPGMFAKMHSLARYILRCNPVMAKLYILLRKMCFKKFDFSTYDIVCLMFDKFYNNRYFNGKNYLLV